MEFNLIVSSLFDKSKGGVSPEQAIEVVRTANRATFLAKGEAVDYEYATCGIHVRTFGKNISTRYSVLVITATDEGKLVIHAALRARHTDVGEIANLSPLAVLGAFLSVFGVEINLPGIGTSDLFLSGLVGLPNSIVTKEQLIRYLASIAEPQGDEPFAMICNTSDVVRDADVCQTSINFLAFYSIEHYQKSINARRHRCNKLPRRQFSPFKKEKSAIRAEYRRLLAEQRYVPPPIDSDWEKNFHEEARKTGLGDYLGLFTGKTRSYQDALDHIAQSVERSIRIRGFTLSCGVYVGEWPLGSIQASVSRGASGNGMLVLVNQGLMAFVYHVAKIFTRSLSFTRFGKKGISFAHQMGWPPLNWTAQDTIESLAHSLAAYLSEKAAPRIPLSDVPRTMFASSLTHWSEAFVVAHEYSHVLHDHVSGTKSEEATEEFGHLEPLGSSQSKEITADLTAMNICLATANWATDDAGLIDANMRVAGTCLLFVVQLFVDGVVTGPHDFTANRPGSHPAPYCRIRAIIDYLKRKYGESILTMAAILDEWIFDLIAPSVERAREILKE